MTQSERLIKFGPDLLTAAEDVLADLQCYVSLHSLGPPERLDNFRTAIINASGKARGAQVPRE